MGETGSDIIIKGGSVELEYNDTLYVKETGDPKIHKCSDRRITQVIITGGGLDYDSGEHPEGLLCTIQVVCRP